MTEFAGRVIDWQRRFGRHDLPWQTRPGQRCDPYSIWLSEVMLQQTQVATVVPYFGRFLQRFPTIVDLAAAPLDEVLRLWAGLGYYARARNLHRAAAHIVDRHDGKFPDSFDDVLQLPGIGRSTASAICALAFGQRRPILDGNVKRVLTRYFGIAGDPAAIEPSLWNKAERLLPGNGIGRYTQGLMDLGALVCTRTRPRCEVCPLSDDCAALRDNRIDELPVGKTRKRGRQKTTAMLILTRGNEVLLEKRAPAGIWGGLWSFPETAATSDAGVRYGMRYQARLQPLSPLPQVVHAFTHFTLLITPLRYAVIDSTLQVAEPGAAWFAIDDALNAATPAPVARILRGLREKSRNRADGGAIP